MSPPLPRRLLSEFVGTYAMILAGTGAVVVDSCFHGALTHLGVALAWGMIVTILIYSFGDISGAHFNPAVSLGFLASGRFPAGELAPYLGAQISGALGASLTLRMLFPADPLLGATLPSGGELQSLILEFLLTLLLMLVILNVSHGPKEKGITAGIAVGMTIGLEALVFGPVCGASMNPARSLAPALVSGHLAHLWIYLTAPLLGSLAAVPLHRLLVSQTRRAA